MALVGSSFCKQSDITLTRCMLYFPIGSANSPCLCPVVVVAAG
jgi:hypothetical protein